VKTIGKTSHALNASHLLTNKPALILPLALPWLGLHCLGSRIILRISAVSFCFLSDSERVCGVCPGGWVSEPARSVPSLVASGVAGSQGGGSRICVAGATRQPSESESESESQSESEQRDCYEYH